MSPQILSLLLLGVLAVLYLALLVTLFKRHAGQETAAMILGIYVAVAMLLVVGEGFWRGGQLYIASKQVANDFQAYGALALAAARIDPPSNITLRTRSDWKILGQSQPRKDMPSKVTGKPIFGIDTQRPDMLYATVKMNPQPGGAMKSFALDGCDQV